jgi:hypothetical protein
MRPGGGKIKGSNFEREISKMLSMWVTEGNRDDVLWKSQNSGGRHTVRKKKNLETANQEGDITYTDELGKPFAELFCTECKNYKDLNIWSMIEDKNVGLLSFWNTLCKIKTKKQFILIAKQNRKPTILLCEKKISQYFTIPAKVIFRIKNKSVALFFLADICKENFKNLYKKIKESGV